MSSPLPHYLLQTETCHTAEGGIRWKFSLQAVGSGEQLAATDAEPGTYRSRLELLAVVRGLEAIDGPARVTLLTRSSYVSDGLRRQLTQWREHKWRWERFGSMAPIRDFDLWRRIDRALEYHTVECCVQQSAGTAAKSQRAAEDESTVAATLSKLSRGVLTPISALWQPSFTPAA
jgi:ribonuclease HI